MGEVRTGRPKTLKALYDPTTFDLLGSLSEEQEITEWYFMTSMAGVGNLYTLGARYRGRLKLVEFQTVEPPRELTLSIVRS